jgi:hypothetical protein
VFSRGPSNPAQKDRFLGGRKGEKEGENGGEDERRERGKKWVWERVGRRGKGKAWEEKVKYIG